MRHHFSLRRDFHKAGERQAHHSFIERAKPIRELLWQHGNHPIQQIDTRSPSKSFFIQRSGGERARVALCILMLSKANLLFLDEPTNHLDIASKEALEDALLGYDGTLLVVSHDRYFIRKLATKVWELENKKITCYAGGYQYYLEEREKSKHAAPETVAIKKEKGENPFAKKREQESALRKLKAKVGRIENAIQETEEEIARCKELISRPDFASDYQALMEESEHLRILEEKLQGFYAEWEEYSSALE
ncbi:MAG: ATP-binding cassette domain-containing protein [Clostridiales bacterium]|nr:ATP-binding cassette domain-containing protein [Clostridiales bacterium]